MDKNMKDNENVEKDIEIKDNELENDAQSAADIDAFKTELAAEGESISENFFNKWVDFETYRKIVFKDQHWN